MDKYRILKLSQCPELLDTAARWFCSKWGIPEEAYRESMKASLEGDPVQTWYLCLDGQRILAGMGLIENDFHDRKDLAPNICAVFTEEAYRGQGIAGRMLDYAVEDCRGRGISPVYLITSHTGFYERYGWEFYCMAQGDDEPEMSRIYIHR